MKAPRCYVLRNLSEFFKEAFR